MNINLITLFIQQENTVGIPLIGIAGINPSDPSWRLDFDPSATEQQITQCNTDASNFNWTPQPEADVTGFYTAIFNDANLSPAAKAVLPLTMPLMMSFISDPSLMN